MKKEKQDIITFKVPESLMEAMKGIPNRSELHKDSRCSGSGQRLPSMQGHRGNHAETATSS